MHVCPFCMQHVTLGTHEDEPGMDQIFRQGREITHRHNYFHLGGGKECPCTFPDRFQSREQEKTGKTGWVEVGGDHSGMFGSENPRSLEFRMCGG